MPALMITHSSVDALKALLPLCAQHLPEATLAMWGELEMVAEAPEPPEPEPSQEMLDLADRIWRVIKPSPSQFERIRFLRILYLESDTFKQSMGHFEGGVPGARGLSRTLGRAFPDASVTVEHLYHTQKLHFPDGEYKGTKYTLTALGRLVLANFKADPLSGHTKA